MRQRSLGLTALAFVSVMVALYCQMAAIALLLTGSVFSSGSTLGVAALVIGAVYLGVTVAAYLLGYGFWASRRWSWAAGLAVFAVFILTSLALAAVSGSIGPSLVPAVGAGAAMFYLMRPDMKAQLAGAPAATETAEAEDRLEGTESLEAEPAR